MADPASQARFFGARPARFRRGAAAIEEIELVVRSGAAWPTPTWGSAAYPSAGRRDAVGAFRESVRLTPLELKPPPAVACLSRERTAEGSGGAAEAGGPDGRRSQRSTSTERRPRRPAGGGSDQAAAGPARGGRPGVPEGAGHRRDHRGRPARAGRGPEAFQEPRRQDAAEESSPAAHY